MKQNETECNISDNQQLAISLIVTGKTDTEIAKELNISRTTLWRWKTEDSGFIVELNKKRREVWGSSIDRLRNLVPKAIEIMEKFIDDNALLDNSSLAAAVHILKAVGIYGVALNPEKLPATKEEVKLEARKKERDFTIEEMITSSF